MKFYLLLRLIVPPTKFKNAPRICSTLIWHFAIFLSSPENVYKMSPTCLRALGGSPKVCTQDVPERFMATQECPLDALDLLVATPKMFPRCYQDA